MEKINDLTPNEIVRYSYLFSLNYSKDDLEKAFSKSSLGASYFLDKWQNYIEQGRTFTLAYFDLYFDLDEEHSAMLIEYIFNKYEKTILSARFWSEQIKKQFP